MRLRLKYFSFDHDFSYEQIARRLSENPYDEEKGVGFEIQDISKGMTKVKFFERKTISEDVIFPSGESQVISRTVYTNYLFDLFSLTSMKSLMRTYNAPASVRSLVSALSEVLDDFAIKIITIDPSEAYEFVANANFVKRFDVPRVVASQIPFPSKAVATIDIKSPHNAYADLLKVYEAKNFRMEKLYMNLRSDDQSLRLEVSLSGTIICSEELVDKIDGFVRSKYLRDMSEQGNHRG